MDRVSKLMKEEDLGIKSELPRGWIDSKLGDICSKPQYGWTSPASQIGELKYIRTTDISSGQINWNTVPYCSKVPEDIAKYIVKEDDILVSRAGSVGISYRINKDPKNAVFASYLIRFKPLEKVAKPKYIELYLKSHLYWKSIYEFTSGIAIPNVNASKLANLDIPLPPLKEQRRIVAKLEKILAKVNTCQQRLERIPTILKRFRQSVLAAAFSGRLTADWREKNCDVEPAEELLTNFKKTKSYKKIKIKNELTIPFDLPLSWEWINLIEGCKSIADGDHQAPPKQERGIPFFSYIKYQRW